MSPLASAATDKGYIKPEPLIILAPMLPDLSRRIKTFAGTSLIPDPGGKFFANEF